MSPPTSPDPGPVAPHVRERADACPGALRLHGADDGWVARIRVPGGRLGLGQAEVLADAAERLGDGSLGLTSRGNIELRGLAETAAPHLSALLTGAALLPDARHERVRNIVAGPLSGLDGRGHADVQAWAARLDALLCAEDWTTGLSGRFLFVLDDGRGDVRGVGGDVTVVAAPGGRAVLRCGGGDDAPAYVVDAAEAPRAALAAARAFLAAARASGTGAWRVRELPPAHRPDVAGALRDEGLAARGAPAGSSGWGGGAVTGPPPGVLPGRAGTAVVCVLAPLGRITAAQWRVLLRTVNGAGDTGGTAGTGAGTGGTGDATVAGDTGDATGARDTRDARGAGELRLTPWRGVVAAAPSPSVAGRWLRELGDAGFVTRADSPWTGVSACTGRPGCAKSRSDVRADARATVTAGPADPVAIDPADPVTVDPAGAVGGSGRGASVAGGGVPGRGAPGRGAPDEEPLPVHWSGCERRCGHPGGDWVDVVAADDALSGYRVRVRRAAAEHHRVPDPAPVPVSAPVSSAAAPPVSAADGDRLARAVAAARTPEASRLPANPDVRETARTPETPSAPGRHRTPGPPRRARTK